MKRIITLLQILFVCIFIVCGGYFAKSMYDKSQTEKEMEYLQSLVKEDETPKKTSEPTKEEINITEPTPVPTPAPEQYEANGMLSRYYALYERNNDTVGWIKINGTNIDYPVVQHSSNNLYYLNRNFDKQKSSSGIPYMDYQCTDASDNIIIYGHNMRNGTMFHALLDYKNKSFWQKNNYIGFDTIYERRLYEIFAVFRTAVGVADEFRYWDFVIAETPDEYAQFVEQCKDLSIYETEIAPQYGEKLLTLSTCSYGAKNERFVVMARMVQ